jgi:hypothetical protein
MMVWDCGALDGGAEYDKDDQDDNGKLLRVWRRLSFHAARKSSAIDVSKANAVIG